MYIVKNLMGDNSLYYLHNYSVTRLVLIQVNMLNSNLPPFTNTHSLHF